MRKPYNENFKHSSEKQRKTVINAKKHPYSLIGRINIVKMAILPKAICIYNSITIKLSTFLHRKIKKIVLKFIWKYIRLGIALKSLSNGRIMTSPYFKWHRPIIIKLQHGIAHKSTYRSMEWNRGPRQNPTQL